MLTLKNSSHENQESLATQTPGQQKDSGRGTTSTQLTDKRPMLCLLIKSPETEQNRNESSTRGTYYYAFPVIRSHNSVSTNISEQLNNCDKFVLFVLSIRNGITMLMLYINFFFKLHSLIVKM